MSLRWLATLRRTYPLGSSCSARSSGSVGEGSATSRCRRRPQGRRGRLPSLTRRRTCGLGSWRHCPRVARVRSKCCTSSGRMANSAVKRWVSACRARSARSGSASPRRAMNSPSGQPIQPASPASLVPMPRVSSGAAGARADSSTPAARSKSAGSVASSASATCMARAFISRPPRPGSARRSNAARLNGGQARCRCSPQARTSAGLIRFLNGSGMPARLDRERQGATASLERGQSTFTRAA